MHVHALKCYLADETSEAILPQADLMEYNQVKPIKSVIDIAYVLNIECRDLGKT